MLIATHAKNSSISNDRFGRGICLCMSGGDAWDIPYSGGMLLLWTELQTVVMNPYLAMSCTMSPASSILSHRTCAMTHVQRVTSWILATQVVTVGARACVRPTQSNRLRKTYLLYSILLSNRCGTSNKWSNWFSKGEYWRLIISKLQLDVNRSGAGKDEIYIHVKSSAVLPRQLLVRRGDKQ